MIFKKTMRWFEFIIKTVLLLISVGSLCSYSLMFYHVWVEYNTLKKELDFKQSLFKLHCSIYDEYKNDIGVVNQCKQWNIDILSMSNTYQKAASNVAQTFRLCGNTDCMEYFGNTAVFLAGITSDVAWFLMTLAFGIVVLILMLSLAIFFTFGRISYKKQKYEDTYGGSTNLPTKQIVHKDLYKLD